MRFRLKVFEPWAEAFRVVPGKVMFSWSGKLNSHSVLTVEVPYGSDAAQLLSGEKEVALEVKAGGEWFEPFGCRFRSRREQSDSGKPGGLVKFTLIGLSSILGDAVVWDSTPDSKDGRLEFHNKTPGFILDSLFGAAKRRTPGGRPWASGLTWNFNGRKDSNGAAWPVKVGNAFVPTTPVWHALDWLSGKGAVDWRMRGRRLEVFVADTVMSVRTNVPLRDVQAVAAPTVVSHELLATTVLMRGESGREWSKSSPDAESAFGRIEAGISQGHVKLDETADLHMSARLKQGEHSAVQYRREWAEDGGDSPRLWVDFQVGDWVSVGGSPMRVVEAGVRVDETGTLSGWETLGTRVDSTVERLQRAAKSAIDGLAGGENSPVIGERGPDFERGVPQPPVGVTVSARSRTSFDGQFHVEGDVRWSPVGLTVDGRPVTVLFYQVRTVDAGGVGRLYRSDWPSLVLPVFPGDSVQVFVRACSKQHVYGDWSAPAVLSVGEDREAPPKPSEPSVSDDLGVLRVSHSGVDSRGVAMPADVARWEVSVSRSSAESDAMPDGAVADAGGLTWYRPGLEPETRYYVRVRAVDKAGNIGAWSDAVSSKVGKVFDDAPLRKEIESGTVIGDNAIKARHLSALSVAGDKLAANSVRAAHMTVGALDGYVLTGAVVQTSRADNAGVKLNSRGLFAYDANGRRTISITGYGGEISGYTIRGGVLESENFGSKVKIANGALVISKNGEDQLTLDDDGLFVKEGKRVIGCIRAQHKNGNPDVKGLSMSLEETGDYVSWGYRERPNDEAYTSFLTFDPKGKFYEGKPGIHVGAPLWVSDVRTDVGTFSFGTTSIQGIGGRHNSFTCGNAGLIIVGHTLYLMTDNRVYNMTEFMNRAY